MAKLWGGRFTKKTNPLVEKFTGSIHYDHKLAEYDCLGSLAHIDVLRKAKLLTTSEHRTLQKGLESILKSIQNGTFKIDSKSEDIHSQIQELLDKKVGKVASKLHTSRSRNDQVVFGVKLYCRQEIANTQKLIADARKSLSKLASKNAKVVLPGYTHLQHAIPVYLSNHLMAYDQMLKADDKRLANALDNIELTMGSGAVAGTFIDAKNYKSTVRSSGEKIQVQAAANSLYTVSDRDFVIEILSALAIAGMHLSRLAEDLILWATKEFDFIDISEEFCTGSSLMPQKKNPDVLELIRGYSGRLDGNLVSVLVMMKGLPLSYNRDMQLDKEPLFESFEIVQKELEILAQLLPGITFKEENIRRQLQDESLYATDLSDHLVKNGVAFKDAHTTIGQLIAYKTKSGKNIVRMSANELNGFHPLLTPAVVKRIIDPEFSVQSKKSIRKK